VAGRRVGPARLAVALVAAVIGLLLSVATSTAALAIQSHGPVDQMPAVAEAHHRPGAEHAYDPVSRSTTLIVNVALATAVTDAGSSVSLARSAVAARSFGATEGGVDIGSANFAQTTYGEAFSSGGRFAGQSIDDVAGAIRSGELSPEDVPIEAINRDGNTLILNTRSAQALERAGIPRSEWNVVNVTGDSAAEARLSGQLARNGLTSSGYPSPTSSGG
jgi:hypothetical protein